MLKSAFFSSVPVLIFFLVFFSCFHTAASAQKVNYFHNYGLKDFPYSVEEYHVFLPTRTNPIYQKRLSNILTFNKDGYLVEMVGFAFQGAGSYYSRSVFSYDSKGRRILVENYRSVPTKAENLLLPDILETGLKKLNPEVKEKLISKFVRKYYDNGRLSDETIYEGNGEINQNSHYTYLDNDETVITVTRNGKPDTEEKISYENNRRRMRYLTYRNGKPEYKSVHQLDKKRRPTYIEQFRIKMSEDGQTPIEINHYTSHISFSRNAQKFETFAFDENGLLIRKSILKLKNNNEQSQIVYQIQKDSKPRKHPEWQLQYQTKTEYQFDKNGSWTKSVKLKKETKDGKFFPEFIKERIIKYY